MFLKKLFKVTHQIWKNNNNLPRGAITINLKGTSVGNGLVDPEVQYGYYPGIYFSFFSLIIIKALY